MDRTAQLAAASRDGHLALRRVERQQALIELLHARHGERVRLEELARETGVSTRTIARDVERLRLSGVPVEARRGRDGGVRLVPVRARIAVQLDLPEVAALLSSIAVLGPTVSPSASSATDKLVAALVLAARAGSSQPVSSQSVAAGMTAKRAES